MSSTQSFGSSFCRASEKDGFVYDVAVGRWCCSKFDHSTLVVSTIRFKMILTRLTKPTFRGREKSWAFEHSCAETRETQNGQLSGQ